MQRFFYFQPGLARPLAVPALPSTEYRAEFWTPHGLQLKHRSLPAMPFLIWGLFHRLGIFSNRHYGIELIRYRGKSVHRSCVFPGYFRFPFMARNDLQVGDTWTAEEHRGKGLATCALVSLVHQLNSPGRRLWYICDETNRSSERVVIKAGFRLAGRGIRTRRLGLSLLGTFVLTEPADWVEGFPTKYENDSIL